MIQGQTKSWIPGAIAIAVLSAVAVPSVVGQELRLFRKYDSVQKLARRIDRLERHIEEYGSVTAKQPDVWGEARLTKHRSEIERELREKVETFNQNMNAAISRSDQAFIAQSIALQGAISGRSAISTSLIDNSDDTQTAITLPSAPTTSVFGAELQRSEGRGTDGFKNGEAIGLEPTTVTNQHYRYLQHLMALRRRNEGDDTADSPGYSLNLMRIPVSVLPGRKTRKGYGAEVTFTVSPSISEELLATTFRDLVINDLVDQLALPVVRIAEAAPDVVEAMSKLRPTLKAAVEKLDELSPGEKSAARVKLERWLTASGKERFSISDLISVRSAYAEFIKESKDRLALREQDLAAIRNVFQQDPQMWGVLIDRLELPSYSPEGRLNLVSRLQGVSNDVAQASVAAKTAGFELAYSGVTRQYSTIQSLGLAAAAGPPAPAMAQRASDAIATATAAQRAGQSLQVDQAEALKTLRELVADASSTKLKIEQSLGPIDVVLASAVPHTSSHRRQARFSLPSSQLLGVYGRRTLIKLGDALEKSFRYGNQPVIHLVDAQDFIRAELEGAYLSLIHI